MHTIENKETESNSIKESFLVLNTKLDEISVINYGLKTLHRSVEFNNYSNESFSQFEIVEILKKSNTELEQLLCLVNDKTDDLLYAFDKNEKENKEDKKRLARLAYAFINNGEIERAKKELEKIIAE